MGLSQPLNVLVVEDEPSMRAVCEGFIRSFGHNVDCVDAAESALSHMKESSYDLVVADYKLPGMDGIQLLQRVKEDAPDTEVIIMTAFADMTSAVQAVRLHAFDYLPKPFELEDMQKAVRKLERIKSLTIENDLLRKQLKKDYGIDRIIGETEGIQQVKKIIERVSHENYTVLIEGESGTGKELVAKAIHYNSPRASKAFVPVDCTSISTTLFESELFGHERGAFTGATQPNIGLFRMADGGTIFLDEIAEVPLDIQVKLLRSLQERWIRPVGSVNEVKVDVRVIAASNRNLQDAAEKGEFRKDLFYRLNVVNIGLPPLRDRKDDLRLLIDHFIKFHGTGSRRLKGISRDAISAVMDYTWPGNVRELENLVERALALGLTDRIEKEDLPPAVLKANEDPAAHLLATDQNIQPLEEVERAAIMMTLEKTGGDKMLAAQVLGIDRSTLYRKLKRF